MSMLSSMVVHLVTASPIPNPPPAAPAEVASKASTVVGFVKWGSLIVSLIGLAGFGMLALAADRGGMGSHSADIKERFGKIVVLIIVTVTSTSIITFLAF